MNQGTANGSNPNQPTIFGRKNINYEGPQRAQDGNMDPTLSTGSMNDFAPVDDDNPVGEYALDTAFTFTDADNESIFQDAGVNPMSACSEYGLLHQKMTSLSEDARNALAVYIEDNEITDADDLDDAMEDDSIQDDIQRAAEETMMVYGEDCLDYVYASPSPVDDLVGIGEEYGYSATEEEITYALIESISEEMNGQTPSVNSVNDLQDMVSNPDTYVSDSNHRSRITTDMDSQQSTMIHNAADYALSIEGDEETKIDAFHEQYQEEINDYLSTRSPRDLFREFVDRSCDDIKVNDTTIKNLSSAVAYRHAQNITRTYIEEGIYRLQNPQ